MQSTKRARMAIFLTVFVDLLGFGIVIPILPLYAQAIAEAGIVAEPVPRQFDDPPTALPSFSRFWQRVVPKAEVGRSWHR